MKTLRYTALALSAMLSLNAMADDEFMVITLEDGTTAEYNVADVTKVNFETRKEVIPEFTVTPAEGETVKFTKIPTLFRVSAASDGQPTIFGIGTVEAATPAELLAGEYGLILSVSAVKIYNGEFDLAENPDSYSLTLAKYEEGALIASEDKVVSGTLSTSIDNRTRKVTIKLNAEMESGTVVTINYTGLPVAAESLEAMLPTIKMGNEIFFRNGSADEEKQQNIVSARYKKSTSYQSFIFESEDGSSDVTLDIYNDALINGGDLDLSNEEVYGFVIKVSYAVQLGRRKKGDLYSNSPTNGKLNITKNDDGTYDIFLEVTNTYKLAWGDGTSGDGSFCRMHYAGTFE